MACFLPYPGSREGDVRGLLMLKRKRVIAFTFVFLLTGAVASAWAVHRVGVAGVLRRVGAPSDVQQKYAAYRSGAIIDDYLNSHAVRKLQIGAGPNNLPDWLNTDIEPIEGQAFLDAGAPFPLPDNSIHYIYAEQLIEHLNPVQATVMLRESYRTLKPEGRLRLATPDLDRMVAMFDEVETDEERRFITAMSKFARISVNDADRPVYILNVFFRRWGHQFLHNQQSLASALKSAGFKDVRVVRYGESDHAALRNIERHIAYVGPDIDLFSTMVVEATK